MKVKYTWAQFETDVEKLLKFLAVSGWEVSDIYGIPRGGLTLATRLSYALDKPLLLDQDAIGPDTLVVDDILDSGKTLAALFESLEADCRVITLHKRPDVTTRYTHFAARETPDWVVYPWEHSEERSKYDGAR